MQNQILGFFVITCVALGILCAAQWRQARHSRSQVAQLQEQIAEQIVLLDGQQVTVESLQREREALRQDLAQSTQTVQTLRDQTNRLAAALAEATRVPWPWGDSGWESLSQIYLALLHDPAAQRWFQSQQETVWKSLYDDLFLQLELNAKEQARLRQLILEQRRVSLSWSASPESTAPVPGEGTSPTPAPANRIRAFLGEKRYAHYEAYLLNLGERLLAQQFRNLLADGLHPLQEQQFSQLLAALQQERQEQPSLQPEPSAASSPSLIEHWQSQLDRQETLYQQLRERAVAFLDPPQLEVLQQLHTQQRQLEILGLEALRQLAGQSSLEPSPAAQSR